ncbi:MAG: histone deacetylase family protein [Anaerolineae bacterium]
MPERAEMIRASIQSAALGPFLLPRDYGLGPILAVHDAGYVAYLRQAYALGQSYALDQAGPLKTGLVRARPVLAARSAVTLARVSEPPRDYPGLRDYYTYDFEDPILNGTWTAAYWSAQSALTAAELVRGGERAVYALCRPPGHHATVDQYGGFCYLNNAAPAARELCRDGSVAILDVDYHHGNGTQAIFYADPRVLYVSLHADPALDYPHFWGYRDEVGEGPGRGTNYNVPLSLGTGDTEYLVALDAALKVISGFAPRHLIVSLGLDAVRGDLIGKFGLTPEGWSEVGRRVAELALPTVIVQEGGYRQEGLGALVVAFLSHFLAPNERC